MAESSNKEDLVEIRRLLRENREMSRRLRGYQGLEAREKKAEEAQIKQSEALEKPTEAKSSVESAMKPHFLGKWQPFCAECGEKNPDFKDETICEGEGCGMHLGSVEGLKDIKACPNCGGHKAKKLEHEEPPTSQENSLVDVKERYTP